MRNLGASVGLSVGTTLLARRGQFHHSRMAEGLTHFRSTIHRKPPVHWRIWTALSNNMRPFGARVFDRVAAELFFAGASNPEQPLCVEANDFSLSRSVRCQPPDASQDLRAITRRARPNPVVTIRAEHQLILMLVDEPTGMIFISRLEIQS